MAVLCADDADPVLGIKRDPTVLGSGTACGGCLHVHLELPWMAPARGHGYNSTPHIIPHVANTYHLSSSVIISIIGAVYRTTKSIHFMLATPPRFVHDWAVKKPARSMIMGLALQVLAGAGVSTTPKFSSNL